MFDALWVWIYICSITLLVRVDRTYELYVSHDVDCKSFFFLSFIQNEKFIREFDTARDWDLDFIWISWFFREIKNPSSIGAEALSMEIFLSAFSGLIVKPMFVHRRSA